MTKLLMSAFIGSNNLGDEAIFEAILANLDKQNLQVTATSVNEAKTIAKGVDTVPAKQPIALLKAIKNTDVISMGGGGIIQDQSSILNIIYYCYQLMLARLFSKPVVLSFVGVGPVSHPLSKWLFRVSSKPIKLAIVRDEASKKLLSQLIGRSDIIKTFHDPVLNYPITSSDMARDPNQVIVSLRKWFFSIPVLPAKLARKVNSMGVRSRAYNELVASFANSFDEFLEKNPAARLKFLSFYDEEDMEITNSVIDLMKYRQRCIAPEPGIDVEQFVRYASESQLLFGMRLHSLILASVAGTPFSSVNYSSKVKHFSNQMRQAEYMVNVEDYKSGFYRALQESYDDSVSNGAIIESLHAEYRRNNLEAFQLINDFIKNYPRTN